MKLKNNGDMLYEYMINKFPEIYCKPSTQNALKEGITSIMERGRFCSDLACLINEVIPCISINEAEFFIDIDTPVGRVVYYSNNGKVGYVKDFYTYDELFEEVKEDTEMGCPVGVIMFNPIFEVIEKKLMQFVSGRLLSYERADYEPKLNILTWDKDNDIYDNVNSAGEFNSYTSALSYCFGHLSDLKNTKSSSNEPVDCYVICDAETDNIYAGVDINPDGSPSVFKIPQYNQ